MSLIKKALERAKKERKLFLGKDRGYREGTGDLPIDRAISSKTKVAPHVLEVPPPTYSDTRSVRVDPETLIDRKVFSILEKDEVADQYKLPAVAGGGTAARAEIGTGRLYIRHRRPVFWRFEVVFWLFPADDSL